jgi:hypothetical protein
MMKLNLFNRDHPELPVYPVENPNVSYDNNDDGTIVENVENFAKEVVGRRIVSAEQKTVTTTYSWGDSRKDCFELTLDDGTRVQLFDFGDCCAYTYVTDFLLHPESVNHVILGVGTTDEYNVWHIYADFGDIMAMQVEWSCGNPFYYAYGFDIRVVPVEEE